MKNSEAIIIVEGRSDVLNLLRAGIKNAVAVEGTNIPKSVQELSKERVTTAFVDGDRGGELILRELFQTSEIDYVARAPRSQEVEELSAKQLVKCLRNKVPGDQYMEMNGLSFKEKELGEGTNERGSAKDRHVRRNAEELAEEREALKQQNEDDEETPAYRNRANEDDEEEEPRFTRNRRERHTRRNAEEDAGEGRFGRNRRERHTRRNAEEDSEEMPTRSRFNEKKRREFLKKDTAEDSEEQPAAEARSRKRREHRVAEPVEEVTEEAPETESVITETEDGNIIVEEIEIKEAAEEPVTEAPVEEPKAEEVPETVAEEPAKEESAAEEAVTEKPAEEEKPKRAIRAPRSRKAKSDKILTEEQETFRDILGDITGTKNAVLLGSERQEIDKVEVKNLANYLKENDASSVESIVFDGVIGQNIVGIASEKGIKTLVGKTKGKIAKLPAELVIWTRTDLF